LSIIDHARCEAHFLNPACQFSATVMGGDGAELVSGGAEIIRNLLPSAVTS
jgi:hypothetical protein